jgi:hypothetical protein
VIRTLATVLAAIVLAGASPKPSSPPSRLLPVAHDRYTAALEAYLSAQKSGRWSDAYALLDDDAKRYYRSVQNFQSVYAADRFVLRAYKLVGMRVDRLGRLYFVHETANYLDHAHDDVLTIDANVPLGVLAERDGLHVKDPGHPWRASAPGAVLENGGVRVTVKKLSYFPHRIEVVLTIANLGDGAVTVLPYGKSVLRDDAGNAYRPIEVRDWTLTDKHLFEGVRIPSSGQYTGFLAFETPALGDGAPRFTLTVAPVLRDGADAPLSLDIPFAGF